MEPLQKISLFVLGTHWLLAVSDHADPAYVPVCWFVIGFETALALLSHRERQSG